MNQPSGNRVFGNLLVLILSSSLSLLVAESVLRAWYPPPGSSSFVHRIPHPQFGWTLEAGASYLNQMPEKTVRVSYNSAGERDLEHTLDKPAGVFRILVLGDSFMEAYSVALEDSFHRQLYSQLHAAGYQVEVINLGVGGYGTLQEALVFEQVGLRYQPDLVLLAFFIRNDVANNSQALQSILYTGDMKVNSRPFLVEKYPSVWTESTVDYKQAVQVYARARQARELLSNRLFEKLAIVRAFITARQQWMPPGRAVNTQAAVSNEPQQPIVAPDSGVQQQRIALAMYGVHYCQEPVEYDLAWQVTGRIMHRLREAVAAAGARLLVFTVPAQIEVFRPGEADMPQIPELCWDDPPGYRRLQSLLAQANVPMHDLLPAFRHNTATTGANLFRRSDRHWNEAGHALASREVLGALQRQNLLPDR